MVWCPEYLKLIRATEYKAHTVHIFGKEYQGYTFNGSLENRQYKDSTFLNCKLVYIIRMLHVKQNQISYDILVSDLPRWYSIM